jgi:NHLM bacteriocin system ABC transporter ATP-binding protein
MSLVPSDDWFATPSAQPVRRAFWADLPRTVWLVAEGGIDLFLQRKTTSDTPAGPRHHVFRALAGQLILGMDPAKLSGGQALIAVPLPGTSLHTADFDWLQRTVPAAEVVRLCEEWVQAIARDMPKPPAPRQAVLLARGATAELDDAQMLRGDKAVAWVEILDGEALWMERGDSAANAVSGPLPLPRDLWLKAAARLMAREAEAAELLHDGRLWQALAAHHRFVLNVLTASAEQALAGERSRLAAKAQRSLSLRREALQRLLSIAAHRGNRAAQARPRNDTCFAACHALGERMGIEFRLPPAAESATMNRNPIEAIAAASGVRYRRTALKGRWWTGDNGPLLAAYAEGGGWVALLPRRNGYEAFDPATGETRPVTEELAARLNSFATMFYRTLPGKPLRLRDVLAFMVRGRGADLGLVLGMGVLGGLLGLAMPIATGLLVDTLIPSANVAAIWQMVGALAAAAVAASLFEISRSIAVLRIESKMDSELQAALWDRVLRLPVGFFRRYSAGDLALRINGVNRIRRELSRSTVDAVLTGLFSVFSYLLLFRYSLPLAGVATLLVLAVLLVTLAIGYAKLRNERGISEVDGQLSALVFQYLLGIVKLRIGAAESQAFANWAARFAHYRRLQFRSQHWTNVGHTFLVGYPIIALAVLFAAMAALTAEGAGPRLGTGDFIAFTMAFGTFFTGMIALAETLLGVLNLVPLYERARPILETLPEIQADAGKVHPGELQGSIEVSKLSFRYGDGPPILRDVSFSAPSGSFVALVGPSGSGKSTLLRLLLGFETPAAGAIYYDSQNLATLDIQALRRQLGVVLQNGQLVSGDIFTNIVGTSGLTVDDAWEAARLVGLDNDINQMPMGMHTLIAEGTNTLSGGQRQRILIARAIVHRPRILFLDEATSALDNGTQAVVTHSLDRLKSTRIVIAHRLSTIVNADRIIVLRNGEVAQVGNYESLIGQPGPFRELAKRQE